MTKLEEFIKEYFKGNNQVRMFISERGNQRIEIEDLDTKEIWQTLEETTPSKDLDSFDEIQDAIIQSLIQQLD